MVNHDKIRQAAKLIIEAIGEDVNREGLIETPDRIARMYDEIFSGIGEDAEKYLSKQFTIESDNLVLEKDISFYSMCEHHFLPFYGKAHIAYIPNGKVTGLSKLARTVEVYSKKPQLQERLTEEIADAIMKYLNAKGVMVIIEAEHMCMAMRGIKKQGSITVTTTCRGDFLNDNNLKNEVFSLIKL
ncbi:GTP cyclohydrolase I FolE [Clostridium folliculivorans]|uniref:GTP cyclohydrolase 1 n=1 Tax=Clostridium folliculivorans TaxID=2886038 RepID=A0A9W5Y2K4_9CLOT|nr:GTP cyclohydrolase I FolE [Clostridium folliculivorans]GKU25569.1 GTP cyclohydrolase 1 [Clostridium folliculivorans]GKU28591.1 GTP cyclohydrolase 1 [Clostridium folliculivorans]